MGVIEVSPLIEYFEHRMRGLITPVGGGYLLSTGVRFILPRQDCPEWVGPRSRIYHVGEVEDPQALTVVELFAGFFWDGATGAIDKGLLVFSAIHDVFCYAHRDTLDIRFRRCGDALAYGLCRGQEVWRGRAWWVSRAVNRYRKMHYEAA